MQIQSIIKRPGGSLIEMPGANYHFKPNELDHHVAEVTIESHVSRLLSITEAFREYDPANAEEPAPKPVLELAVTTTADIAAPAGALAGLTLSLEHPDAFAVGEETVTQLEVIQRIIDGKLGGTVNDWQDLSDGARADMIDEELEEMQAAADASNVESGDQAEDQAGDKADMADERIKLVDAYVAKFGEKPHHFLSAAKIRARLEEE